MHIESICIPSSLGAPTLNADWNDLDDPPNAIGRMISIGFDALHQGVSGGWGSGYLVYSTYDFEGGSEYSVFATEEDFLRTRARSLPRMISVDGIDGFVRFFPGIAMPIQPVELTYIFPFDTYYVAAVLTLGEYDSSQVAEAIARMQAGAHPDLANPNIPLFNELVSSIRFQ